MLAPKPKVVAEKRVRAADNDVRGEPHEEHHDKDEMKNRYHPTHIEETLKKRQQELEAKLA